MPPCCSTSIQTKTMRHWSVPRYKNGTGISSSPPTQRPCRGKNSLPLRGAPTESSLTSPKSLMQAGRLSARLPSFAVAMAAASRSSFPCVSMREPRKRRQGLNGRSKSSAIIYGSSMKSSEFAYLLQKIQVMLLADQEREKTGEHHFTIIHGHAKRLVPGGPLVCAPGEIILAVQYGRGEDATSIDFSVKDMLIFDCLARHSEFGQSAGQLVANFAHDPFVRHHGENSGAD